MGFFTAPSYFLGWWRTSSGFGQSSDPIWVFYSVFMEFNSFSENGSLLVASCIANFATKAASSYKMCYLVWSSIGLTTISKPFRHSPCNVFKAFFCVYLNQELIGLYSWLWNKPKFHSNRDFKIYLLILIARSLEHKKRSLKLVSSIYYSGWLTCGSWYSLLPPLSWLKLAEMES